LNWCIAKPGVIAITKSNSAERIFQACQASGWRLSAEQMRKLEEAIPYRKRGSAAIALRRLARVVLERIRH
jgi:diketogulonate reductase-like aldo/keto reductase